MRLLQRSGVCALALVAGAAALQFEPAVVRNLTFGEGRQRVAVGAVKVPLWSAALAQSVESFSLENVSFTFGGASYEIPRVELTGVTASRAEVEALFSSASTEPLMQRLKKVNARQISIPEASVRQTFGRDTLTGSYRNIVLTDITGGRIASTTVEATAAESKNAETTVLISAGRATLSDMDVGALANLYETKAENTSAPLSRIYGAFSVDNIDVTDSKEGVNFKIARLSGRDFLARPTRDSWGGTGTLLAELGDKGEVAPDDISRVAALYSDLMGAFNMGLVEATGIEIKGSADQPKGKDSVGRIGRIAYTGSAGSQPAEFRIEGMDFGKQDSHVRIAAVSLTGFSIAPTLEGLENIGKSPLDKFTTEALRSLIPTLGTLRISGVDLDVPDDESTDDRPQRIRYTVKDVALTADRPVNGIPTNIRLDQSDVVFKVPENTDNLVANEILALGYTTLGSSSLIAATWNEASSAIDLQELSVDVQDMGRVSLKGLIGNADRDLFSTDNGTALGALMGLKARSVDLVIEDKGFVSRYFAKTAKEQKTSPDSLRRSYAGAAPAIISSMIGNSEQAKAVGRAVSRFITQPGKLTISVQPKNPSGLGVIEAMMISEPKDLMPKVNITAKAE
jgi:hypothetical protein